MQIKLLIVVAAVVVVDRHTVRDNVNFISQAEEGGGAIHLYSPLMLQKLTWAAAVRPLCRLCLYS